MGVRWETLSEFKLMADPEMHVYRCMHGQYIRIC